MYDRLLVDPDESRLVLALRDAGQNAGIAQERFTRKPLVNILDEMESNTEGLLQMEQRESGPGDTRYLCVAWWTDYRGIRHVRVCGGNLAEGRHLHYCRTDVDSRPPLWHVYPEHVYRVHRDPFWLASCSCGATGPPGTLGWMGPCCGPCHDRQEEGEVLPFATRRTILDQQAGPICSLAFSPDGNTLAVSSAGRLVHLHDLRDGKSEWLYSSSTDYAVQEELRPVLFSPDGRFLAAGEHDVWSVRVWSLEQSDGGGEELFTNESRVQALVFSPDSRHLAAVTSGNQLFIWRHLGREWHDQEYSQDEGVASVDFSPDGQTLALGGFSGTVILRDLATWKETRRLLTGAQRDEEVFFIQYTPDGLSLVLITGSSEVGHWMRNSIQLRLWNLERPYEVEYANIPIISSGALSPDGRFLAWIAHDDQNSPAEVTFWDLDDWRVAGWLEWNSEDDLRELAFSPDGETLAIGSASGVVKLVPWRLLMAPTV